MKILPVLLALLATGAATDALAQSNSKVVPEPNRTQTGNDSATMPFGYDSFRSQQIYPGTTIANSNATITGVAFRPDFEVTSPLQVQNVTVQLCETTVTPQNMNTLFSANLTSTPSTVFTGTVNLPAQGAVPFGPYPFSLMIPFSTPFAFPATSNLVVDITAANGAPGQRIAYSVDAALPGGTVERYGSDGTGIDNLNFDAYGTNAAPVRPSLVPGGGVEVTTSIASWLPNYAGATLIGLTPQVIDLGPLGAPGNSVYVDNIVGVHPHVWQSTFISKIAVFGFGIPNVPGIVDASIYAQSALLEPSANAFGIVTTRGLRLAIGDMTREFTQLVTSDDPTSNFGTYHFSQTDLGGAVTEFTGTFN